MFIIILLILALLELIFVPFSEENVIIILSALIILIALLEFIFPRSSRRFQRLSQERLKEIFGIKGIEVGFGYMPEFIDRLHLSLSATDSKFERGLKLKLPHSFEHNYSAYINFSYDAGFSKKGRRTTIAGITDLVIRAELIGEKGQAIPLRGPIHTQTIEGLSIDQFFLDRSIERMKGCTVKAYAIVLSTKTDYAVYHFPSVSLEIRPPMELLSGAPQKGTQQQLMAIQPRDKK